MKRPLVYLACWLIAGEVLARVCPMPPWILWLGLGVVLAGEGWLVRKAPRPADPVKTRGVLLLAAFALIGAIGEQRVDSIDDAAQSAIASLDARNTVNVSGVVVGPALARPDGWSAVVGDPLITQNERQLRLPERIEINYRKPLLPAKRPAAEPFEPLPGQIIRASGKLQSPEPPGNPDSFDYSAYLRVHGIAATLSCYSARQIDCAEPEGGIGLGARLQRLIDNYGDWSVDQLQRFAGDHWTPLLRAMLFGETAALDSSEKDALVRTGLAHLWAASGLHAGMIALLAFVLLRLCAAPWRFSWIAMAAAIWIYAALVGFRPPVVRCAILATALSSAHVFGREPDSLNSLGLAALLVLLLDPHALYKADFQLSYLCIVSIVVLTPGLMTLFAQPDQPQQRRGYWAGLAHRYLIEEGLISPVVWTLAAQLGLLPLLVHYFHQFSLISFAANILVMPFAAASIVLGFLIVTIGGLIPPLGFLLGGACVAMLTVFHALVHALAAPSWASLPMGSMPWWSCGAYYAALFGGCYVRPMRAPGDAEKGRARLLILGAVIVVLVVWINVFRAPSQGQLMVRLLDVGEGDSILLQTPRGQTMLIDGGSGVPADKGKSVVVPYLLAHGIHHLNAVVATHGDNDHIGGLITVLEKVPTDLVVLGYEDEQTAVTRKFDETVAREHLRTLHVTRGDHFDGLDGCVVAVLNPPRKPIGNDNDDCVVLRVQFGNRAFLFTGDAGRKAEDSMLASGENLRCDVLKAGHHGSGYSSEMPFLQAVAPEMVLISVGAHNRYGHPSPAAMERFKDVHAQIYRTDQQGSVAVFSDGQGLKVETQRNN